MVGEWWWSELRNRAPIHQFHPETPKIIAFSPSGKYRWINIPTDFPCHDKQTCKPEAGSQLLLILEIMGSGPSITLLGRHRDTRTGRQHPGIQKKWRHKAAIGNLVINRYFKFMYSCGAGRCPPVRSNQIQTTKRQQEPVLLLAAHCRHPHQTSRF